MYILKTGITSPEYYVGGTHQVNGEKIPNTSRITDKAKQYSNYEKAEKEAVKLNKKFYGEIDFLVVEEN